MQPAVKAQHIHSYCRFYLLLPEVVIYKQAFYMVCILGSCAQPISELTYLAQLPTLPVGKGNHKAHPLHSAPATLSGCAVRFSCSIARW